MSVWDEWAGRWERFQDAYVPLRDVQLDLVVDYAAEAVSDPRPAVLDLASGPGTLARRAAARLPQARIVAVDLDPWLIALGRRQAPSTVSWVEADLRDPGWTASLPAQRFDAIVSSTALHWLEPDRLWGLYAELASLLAPAGVFLNADVIPPGAGTGRIAAISRRRLEESQAANARAPAGETWYEFWRAAEAQREFAELIRLRERRLGPRPPRVALGFDGHAERLRAAGFSDVAEVWRLHAAAVIAATMDR
jgi:SAM-dependent methyltransferase